MKKLLSLIITISLCAAMLALCGCTAETREQTIQLYALDTVIDITAYGDRAAEALSAAEAEINRLGRLLSVTDESSDISQINRSLDTPVAVSDETLALIKYSTEVSAITNGRFDITVYPLVRLWGFTTGDYRVPTDNEISESLNNVSYKRIDIDEAASTVTVPRGTMLDLGGIAKGYIADKAAQAMLISGATGAVINLGGNVRTVGQKPDASPWRVGVEYPDRQEYFAVINSPHTSVITSGAYQRNFTEGGKTYHHIIDPSTGSPSDSGILSVTVTGNDGAQCDALSTALFIGGRDEAQRLYTEDGSFEYIILCDSGVYASAGLRGRLSLAKGYEDLDLNFVNK